jgi:hypothetical protein
LQNITKPKEELRLNISVWFTNYTKNFQTIFLFSINKKRVDLSPKKSYDSRIALVAQWLEQSAHNGLAVGSNPTGRTNFNTFKIKMKAILEFDLDKDEDAHSFEVASKAQNILYILTQTLQSTRSHIKYGTEPSWNTETVEAIRQRIIDLAVEQGVDFLI